MASIRVVPKATGGFSGSIRRPPTHSVTLGPGRLRRPGGVLRLSLFMGGSYPMPMGRRRGGQHVGVRDGGSCSGRARSAATTSRPKSPSATWTSPGRPDCWHWPRAAGCWFSTTIPSRISRSSQSAVCSTRCPCSPVMRDQGLEEVLLQLRSPEPLEPRELQELQAPARFLDQARLADSPAAVDGDQAGAVRVADTTWPRGYDTTEAFVIHGPQTEHPPSPTSRLKCGHGHSRRHLNGHFSSIDFWPFRA